MSSVLAQLGARVRALRSTQRLSLRELAARAGLSSRFLSELEAGRANISVRRLSEVAHALGRGAGELLAEAERAAEENRGREPLLVSLLGLRGAGKSTIGPLLARRLDLPFFELDRFVEEAAGIGLAELFSLSGETYYRALELEVLRRVLDEHPRAVLATGGGIVTNRDAFRVLRERTFTVWLRASPAQHWTRVVQQGDTRPMAGIPGAREELERILAARASRYARARLRVDTERLGVGGSVDAIAQALGQ